jgi:hypothetical protein
VGCLVATELGHHFIYEFQQNDSMGKHDFKLRPVICDSLWKPLQI